MQYKLSTLVMIPALVFALIFAPLPSASANAVAPSDVSDGLLQAVLEATGSPLEAGRGYHTGGLDVTLNAGGLRASGDGFVWGIALSGFGRGRQVESVSEAEAIPSAGRLEYRRPGLTEWHRSTAFGMEQGFVISQSPSGNGQLILQLDVETDLEGVLDKDERGLTFVGAEGQALRYDHLKAYDARGVELEAGMDYQSRRVQIHVDDLGAVYPITIDPLIYLEQKVLASDGAANDFLGGSVALADDTALVGASGDDVGANGDQGAVYVFVRSGMTWIWQAKLTASDGAAGDNFGRSVALSGDTALVGASGDNVGANGDQGSAYVFVRNGTVWSQQAKLTVATGAANDNFGLSVALLDGTALVGVPGDDVGANFNQGSAYVFVRSGTTWTQQAQLTSSDGAAGDNFGASLALAGGTALVGAPLDNGDATDQGSAYVFVRGGTTWTQQAQLTALDGAANDYFGGSTALSGDTALVGAYGDNVDAAVNQGSAYIFTRADTVWSQQAQLTASDGTEGDNFGRSVALLGDTARVGAHFDDADTADQGSAYIFMHNKTTWIEQARLVASDGAEGDNFGVSVALSGGMALVGAESDDVGTNTNQGSAFFYRAYYTDADLAVSVTRGSDAPLHPGDSVLLTVSVLNYGPASAPAVLLDAALPSGLTYVSHTVTHGSYAPSIHSWSAGTLNVGVMASLVIEATADSIPSQTLIFSPYLLSRDTNDANNTASLSLLVRTPHEIARNGGFNLYAGGSKIPRYWTAVRFDSTDGKSTTAKKEGAASVKIGNTSAVTKVLSQTLSMSGPKGDEFQLSFWVKGDSIPAAGICRVQVLLYNGGALKLTRTVSCRGGTYGFQKKSLNFVAASAYTKVVIKITYSKPQGTAWFDALSLMKTP